MVLKDYKPSFDKNNIHDIRTATRRLDASFISLPKKMRRKTKIRKYVTTSKQLFKANSQVRDCDIIFEKLLKYSSQPIYTKLIGSLNRKRKTKLASARKIALSLRDLPVPPVRENEIPAKQLEMG
jgi:CHAD domain-containing protein